MRKTKMKMRAAEWAGEDRKVVDANTMNQIHQEVQAEETARTGLLLILEILGDRSKGV